MPTLGAAGTETAPFTNYTTHHPHPGQKTPGCRKPHIPSHLHNFLSFTLQPRRLSPPECRLPLSFAHSSDVGTPRPALALPHGLGGQSQAGGGEGVHSGGPLPPPVPQGLPSLVGEEASQVGGCRFAGEDGWDRDAPAQLVWRRKGGLSGGKGPEGPPKAPSEAACLHSPSSQTMLSRSSEPTLWTMTARNPAC